MTTQHPRRSTVLPMRYVLVFWLFVLSAIAYLDRTNISIAGIQIRQEFAIDNTHLGWLISAFLIGYAAFQVPAGLLVHRFGSRIVLTYAVLWWGLFSVLTALVPPSARGALVMLVLVRFSLGAGEATMYPATSQFVERWFPAVERGRANGIIFAGVGVGSGITPPIVTFIMLHFGWRSSFWFSALIGLVGGLIWYFAARNTPEQHRLVSEQELALICVGREDRFEETETSEAAVAPKRSVPWLRLFTSKEMLALTLSYFALGYVAWIFFGWFYIYLAQARGLNLRSSAVYSMLPFIGMTIGCLLGGVASDWLVKRVGPRIGRSGLAACCFGLTAVFLVFGAAAHEPATAAIVLACGAGCLYVPAGAFWAVAADFGGDFAGLSSGIMNMGSQIGGAVTASLTPYLAAHFGWHTSFFTAAALATIGAISWLMVDPRRRLTVESPLGPS
jgi:MFS transporter, ACS family, glucarate transporter